jgi:hypothetical protein
MDTSFATQSVVNVEKLVIAVELGAATAFLALAKK